MCEKFGTRALYPCLSELIENDDDLAGELDDNGVETAKMLTAAGNGSHLWAYMDEIHKMPSMKLIMHLITEARLTQQN